MKSVKKPKLTEEQVLKIAEAQIEWANKGIALYSKIHDFLGEQEAEVNTVILAMLMFHKSNCDRFPDNVRAMEQIVDTLMEMRATNLQETAHD